MAIRILILEDYFPDVELVLNILRSEGFKFEYRHVDTRAKFIQELKEYQPDIIIADYVLPGFDAMQALVLTLELQPDTPFIICTGSMGEDIAVDCIKAGAADYVIKEHLPRLPIAVREELKKRQIRIEKKQAETQLRESEAKFRSLFQNNNAIMLLIDPAEGAIVDANPAASKFYGWSYQELTSMNIADINTLKPEQILAEINKVLEGLSSHFEFRHRLKDGGTRAVEVFSSPITHQGKTLLYSIVQDITPRKQAEERLQHKMDELTRFQTLTIGRELKMVELKKEVNDLLAELGKPARYSLND